MGITLFSVEWNWYNIKKYVKVIPKTWKKKIHNFFIGFKVVGPKRPLSYCNIITCGNNFLLMEKKPRALVLGNDCATCIISQLICYKKIEFSLIRLRDVIEYFLNITFSSFKFTSFNFNCNSSARIALALWNI